MQRQIYSPWARWQVFGISEINTQILSGIGCLEQGALGVYPSYRSLPQASHNPEIRHNHRHAAHRRRIHLEDRAPKLLTLRSCGKQWRRERRTNNGQEHFLPACAVSRRGWAGRGGTSHHSFFDARRAGRARRVAGLFGLSGWSGLSG